MPSQAGRTRPARSREDDGGDDQGKERAQDQVRHPDVGPRRDGGQRRLDQESQQQAEHGGAADPQRRYGGNGHRAATSWVSGDSRSSGRSIVCVSATPVAALL